MDKVLPIIIICSLGIAVALGYIVSVIVRAVLRKRGKRPNEFEIDEDTLTIHLRKKK